MEDVEISGYRPGAIGKITELHARYYSQESGFGLFFESKVAREMSEFLGRMDESRDGFWVAIVGEEIVGSLALDGIEARSKGAHLRWFIVSPPYRGRGIGNRLLREALDFCRESGFKRVYLWTFEGLDRARHLYEKYGFTVSKELDNNQWGVTVHEQMFELFL